MSQRRSLTSAGRPTLNASAERLTPLVEFPEVMRAIRELERRLRERLGKGAAFALIVADIEADQLAVRRLSNCDAELTMKLYELALLVDFAPEDVAPWRTN